MAFGPGTKKKRKKPFGTTMPKMGEAKNMGEKMGGLLGVTRKKPEPDMPVRKLPVGFGSGAKGVRGEKIARAARMKRLEGRRI